jgi:hypothetical protein
MSFRHLALLAAICAGCGGFARGDRLPDDDGDTTPSADSDATVLSFAADVDPVLTSKCGACHGAGGVASASSFRLSGDTGADYGVVTRLVSTSAPASSTLLQRASGVSHGGGTVLAPSSADYQTIETWISEGAAP